MSLLRFLLVRVHRPLSVPVASVIHNHQSTPGASLPPPAACPLGRWCFVALARAYAVGLVGLDGHLVQVEADLA